MGWHFVKVLAMADSVESRVIRIVGQVLKDAGTITRDSRFNEDLSVDSIDLVEIVSLLEGEFKRKIPEEVIDHIATVGDVIDFIESLDKTKAQ
jgi:acyl carrier protein